MPPLLMVSEPTSGGLLVRGVACLNSFKTNLKGLAWGATCLYGFLFYLQGTVGPGCSLFTRFQNLPTVGLGCRQI